MFGATLSEMVDDLLDHKRTARVRHGNPCPICGCDTWCLRNEHIAICARVSQGAVLDKHNQARRVGEFGFLHLLSFGPIDWQPPPRSAKPRTPDVSNQQLDARWRPIIERCAKETAEVERLAGILGVSPASLQALQVGYGESDDAPAWCFPEKDAHGRILGLNLRLEEKDSQGRTKRQATGGHRGLTYADNWLDYPGPVYIVEGGSDTAAGLTLGICVVGRPSNTGGVALLAELLSSSGRTKAIILAERDRKRHESLKPQVRAHHNPRCPGCGVCWPGKYGAVQLEKALREKTALQVGYHFLPQNAKDLRQLLNITCKVPSLLKSFSAMEVLKRRFLLY